MTTNEAPEKIYLIRNIPSYTSLNTTNDWHGKYLQEWYKSREKDADVEYIRKDIVNSMLEMVIRPTKSDVRGDAFIEKACSGIEKLLSGYIIRNFHFGDSYDIDKLIEDFKEYMKG